MRFKMGVLIAAVLIGTVSLSGIASAASTSKRPVSKESLKKAFGRFGTEAEVKLDSDGSPRASFKVDGYKAFVIAYDCQAGTCSSVQFHSGFETSKTIDLARINKWNAITRYAKVYISDSNAVVVEYDVDIMKSEAASQLEEALITYRATLRSFVKEFID
ncbi:YbjN domain-containing protein [Geomonas sp. RF6]|uniref:YbjN domain-containing protein n=1 Tax=Geomonas sp. RF6 TaxID=2897342 RepID=UPI001E4CE6B9|nr:YbjN domain-containing protein [Geomonas sp. RF6]UFS71370.1 YbjN domain-containing protein [Geomonas sp. RF6]